MQNQTMPQLTKIDWKSLWGILWRVLLLAPVLWVLGLALLVIVLGAFIVPPFSAGFSHADPALDVGRI